MKKIRIIFVSLIIIMNLFVITTFATTSVTIDGLSFSKENSFYHNAIIDTETGNVVTPSFINNIEENSNVKVEWEENTGKAIINLYNLNVDSEETAFVISGDAEIVVGPETVNTITSINNGITSNGSLKISGKGKLEIVSDIESSNNTIDAIISSKSIEINDIELIITGQNCINSPEISLKNLNLTLVGSKNGIIAESETKDVNINIENCNGSITGLKMTGVRAAGRDTTVNVLNSSLVVQGNPERTNKPTYYCAGFYVSSKFDSLVTMNIINCESIYASGGNAGIIMDNSSKDNTNPVTLNIENSNVKTETNTVYWAAIFMNNFGLSENAAAKINIKNNTITANAPKDVGIMTSTSGTKADSIVEIKDSTVNLDGIAAGIRVRASDGEAEDAITTVVNSVVSSPNSVGIDTQAKSESGSWVTGTVETSDGGLIIDKQSSGLTGVVYSEITLSNDVTLTENAQWSSVDGAVMEIKPGVTVTFKSESGDSNVTFPAGGKITVSETGKLLYTVNTQELIINKEKITLKKGNTEKLVVTTLPYNATTDLYWESSNEKIATVDNDGVITAIAKGKATVTITEKNSGLFDICEITVTSKNKTVKERKIEIYNSKGGRVFSNKSYARKGNIIELCVEEDDGYVLDNIKVYDANDIELEIIKKEDKIYTFKMPSSKVEVYAEFIKKKCEGRYEDKCPSIAFNDLDSSMWYHLDVDNILNRKLMIGYNNNFFGSDDNITRGQIVTILWRLENKPIVNYLIPYDDVEEDTYYSEAIRWATSEKIVNGYNNNMFGPNDFITREQLATMIYRYEKYIGGGFTGVWAIKLEYNDIIELDEYAYESICWCTMNKIIVGDEKHYLNPKNYATRVEAAAIISRYLELELEKDK